MKKERVMKYENPMTPDGERIISAGTPVDDESVVEEVNTQQTVSEETDSVKEQKVNKETEYEKKGKNLFYHHKIIYFMFCTFAGILLTFLLGQLIMQPFLNAEWALNYVASFNERIQSADGMGATTGILCNMCSVILVIINLVIRIINRKVFKYAKKTHDMMESKKKGG